MNQDNRYRNSALINEAPFAMNGGESAIINMNLNNNFMNYQSGSTTADIISGYELSKFKSNDTIDNHRMKNIGQWMDDADENVQEDEYGERIQRNESIDQRKMNLDGLQIVKKFRPSKISHIMSDGQEDVETKLAKRSPLCSVGNIINQVALRVAEHRNCMRAENDGTILFCFACNKVVDHHRSHCKDHCKRPKHLRNITRLLGTNYTPTHEQSSNQDQTMTQFEDLDEYLQDFEKLTGERISKELGLFRCKMLRMGCIDDLTEKQCNEMIRKAEQYTGLNGVSSDSSSSSSLVHSLIPIVMKNEINQIGKTIHENFISIQFYIQPFTHPPAQHAIISIGIQWIDENFVSYHKIIKVQDVSTLSNESILQSNETSTTSLDSKVRTFIRSHLDETLRELKLTTNHHGHYTQILSISHDLSIESQSNQSSLMQLNPILEHHPKDSPEILRQSSSSSNSSHYDDIGLIVEQQQKSLRSPNQSTDEDTTGPLTHSSLGKSPSITSDESQGNVKELSCFLTAILNTMKQLTLSHLFSFKVFLYSLMEHSPYHQTHWKSCSNNGWNYPPQSSHSNLFTDYEFYQQLLEHWNEVILMLLQPIDPSINSPSVEFIDQIQRIILSKADLEYLLIELFIVVKICEPWIKVLQLFRIDHPVKKPLEEWNTADERVIDMSSMFIYDAMQVILQWIQEVQTIVNHIQHRDILPGTKDLYIFYCSNYVLNDDANSRNEGNLPLEGQIIFLDIFEIDDKVRKILLPVINYFDNLWYNRGQEAVPPDGGLSAGVYPNTLQDDTNSLYQVFKMLNPLAMKQMLEMDQSLLGVRDSNVFIRKIKAVQMYLNWPQHTSRRLALIQSEYILYVQELENESIGIANLPSYATMIDYAVAIKVYWTETKYKYPFLYALTRLCLSISSHCLPTKLAGEALERKLTTIHDQTTRYPSLSIMLQHNNPSLRTPQ